MSSSDARTVGHVSLWTEEVKNEVWNEMVKYLRFAETDEKGAVPMDTSIIEYVTVLIANGKKEREVGELLDAFLKKANHFSTWLFAYLKGVSTSVKISVAKLNSDQQKIVVKSRKKPCRPAQTKRIAKEEPTGGALDSPKADDDAMEEDPPETQNVPKKKSSQNSAASEPSAPAVKIKSEITSEPSSDETKSKSDYFFVVDNPAQKLKGKDFNICWEFVSIYGCRKKDKCSWRHELPENRMLLRSVHKSEKVTTVPNDPYIRRYTPYGSDSVQYRNISWHTRSKGYGAS